MSLSKVHVAAEGCVDISGSCCGQKPCESPCSIPPLTEKGKETSFAVVVMTALTVKDKRHRLLWQPPHPLPPSSKKEKQKRKKKKPLKRTVKIWQGDRNAEGKLFTVDGFWGHEAGKDSIFFKRLAFGSLAKFPGVYGQHKGTWFFYYYFLGERLQ